jgi:hypothetical protein
MNIGDGKRLADSDTTIIAVSIAGFPLARTSESVTDESKLLVAPDATSTLMTMNMIISDTNVADLMSTTAFFTLSICYTWLDDGLIR